VAERLNAAVSKTAGACKRVPCRFSRAPKAAVVLNRHHRSLTDLRFEGSRVLVAMAARRRWSVAQRLADWFADRGMITISRFDSADEAFASNEKAANRVRNNVLQFTKGMPQVIVGNTLIAEVKE
jgi:hypothetical protein